MKILILNSNNPYITAGVVTHNLFTGLQSKGHYVKMIVKEYSNYKENDIVCIQNWRDILLFKIKNRTKKILRIKNNAYDFLDDEYSIHDYDQTKQYFSTKEVLKHVDFKPDVILYMFPQWFLNIENLHELNKATGAPIFWYLMDPAALTGGCHYFWDCNKYLSGCGSCPGMNSTNPNDQSSINFNFKRKFINKTDIRLITATGVDFEQAKESLLYKNKPVHKAFLPVDHEIFKPVSKNGLRNKLKLPKDKTIFFIGSNNLANRRKGMDYLVKALKGQNIKQDIFILIAGNRFDYIEKDIPFDYKYLGHFDNREQLAEAFQASDFFICPSIEDAGPFMINQSIMSGTPVVSFKIGVAYDLVIPNKTGFLAELKNYKQLAEEINKASSLNKIELQEMSDNCRQMGVEKLHLETFIEEIEKVFINH